MASQDSSMMGLCAVVCFVVMIFTWQIEKCLVNNPLKGTFYLKVSINFLTLTAHVLDNMGTSLPEGLLHILSGLEGIPVSTVAMAFTPKSTDFQILHLLASVIHVVLVFFLCKSINFFRGSERGCIDPKISVYNKIFFCGTVLTSSCRVCILSVIQKPLRYFRPT